MRKRRVYLFLLMIGVAVLVGVIVAGAFGSKEPEYGGKRLSEWVLELTGQLSDDNGGTVMTAGPPVEAIQHIGTNALSYLLKWIGYEVPAWRKKLDPISAKVLGPRNALWNQREKKLQRRTATSFAFRALGPKAKGAIPDLCHMMSDPRRDSSAQYAASALVCLGVDAIPALVTGLTNKDQFVRQIVASHLGTMGTNALPAVPELVKLLRDPVFFVRNAATEALHQLDPEALERATR